MLQYPVRKCSVFYSFDPAKYHSKESHGPIKKASVGMNMTLPQSHPLHSVMRQSAAGVMAVRVSCWDT